MLARLAHRILEGLPPGARFAAMQQYYAWQVKTSRFTSPEHEFRELHQWVRRGSWALDVGANVGHYTLALSALVGKAGRVFAFEPVSRNFGLLASNVACLARWPNVTLMNVGVSDSFRETDIWLPRDAQGVTNFYQASVRSQHTDSESFRTVCLDIDRLQIPSRVSFAKIDVEGHEVSVLKGMSALIQRDRPVLVIETSQECADAMLADLHYSISRSQESPNVVCVPKHVR